MHRKQNLARNLQFPAHQMKSIKIYKVTPTQKLEREKQMLLFLMITSLQVKSERKTHTQKRGRKRIKRLK